MAIMTCFMMMQFAGEYQNTIFEKVQEAVIRANALGDYRIRLVRADLGQPLDIMSLDHHLKQHIDRCDFAIAEISTFNPNVMFEMGYAIGVNKPVIIMVQRGIPVPADFRGWLYLEYSIEELDLVPQLLQGYLKSAIEARLTVRQKNTYYTKVFANRGVSDIEQRAREAKDKIEILTTNLNSFIEQGLGSIVEQRLCDPIVPNLKVRILTLDPESDFAGHRARQLKMSILYFREQLRSSLEKTIELFGKFSDRCNIATFDEFPPQISFRIDDNVYSNIVSSNHQSRNNLLLSFHISDAGVKESITNHFDTVWGRSTPLHRV